TVKLHGAKAINPTVAPPGHLGAHHVAAVRIGPLPIRDMDHAAIEFKLGHEGLPPAPRHTPLYHLNAKVGGPTPRQLNQPVGEAAGSRAACRRRGHDPDTPLGSVVGRVSEAWGRAKEDPQQLCCISRNSRVVWLVAHWPHTTGP